MSFVDFPQDILRLSDVSISPDNHFSHCTEDASQVLEIPM